MQHHPGSWYMPWGVPLQKMALAVPFHPTVAAVGYHQTQTPGVQVAAGPTQTHQHQQHQHQQQQQHTAQTHHQTYQTHQIHPATAALHQQLQVCVYVCSTHCKWIKINFITKNIQNSYSPIWRVTVMKSQPYGIFTLNYIILFSFHFPFSTIDLSLCVFHTLKHMCSIITRPQPRCSHHYHCEHSSAQHQHHITWIWASRR